MLALNLPLDYRTKAWHIPGFKFEKGIFGIDQTIMFKPRHMLFHLFNALRKKMAFETGFFCWKCLCCCLPQPHCTS